MEMKVSKILDSVDRHILDILQKGNQISNTELAKLVNLSPPAVHGRIKRLVKENFISRQVAILNPEKLGYDLMCFIFINTTIHQEEELSVLESALANMPEIMECHCLTGEYDYLLKVVRRDRKELEGFIRKLNRLGITKIQTSLALREIKSSAILPLEAE